MSNPKNQIIRKSLGKVIQSASVTPKAANIAEKKRASKQEKEQPMEKSLEKKPLKRKTPSKSGGAVTLRKSKSNNKLGGGLKSTVNKQVPNPAFINSALLTAVGMQHSASAIALNKQLTNPMI